MKNNKRSMVVDKMIELDSKASQLRIEIIKIVSNCDQLPIELVNKFNDANIAISNFSDELKSKSGI